MVDISDPANPQFLKNWGSQSENPHEGVVVQDGIAYLGSENGMGAAIVDVRNPLTPVLLSRIKTIDGGSDYVHNIVVEGKYLYIVTNRGPDVYVFDVSNPSLPVKVRTITSPSGYQIHDITVVNGRLYMHEITGYGLTQVFDIADVENSAKHLGSFNSGASSHSGWWTEDYDHLLVSREPLGPGGTAGIFRVTDASNAQRVATLDPVEIGLGNAQPHDGRILDNILYFAWGDGGFVTFELSDPTDPVLLDRYITDPLTVNLFETFEVFPFLGPDRVIVSDILNGLFVFDTTPSAIRSGKFTVQ